MFKPLASIPFNVDILTRISRLLATHVTPVNRTRSKTGFSFAKHCRTIPRESILDVFSHTIVVRLSIPAIEKLSSDRLIWFLSDKLRNVSGRCNCFSIPPEGSTTAVIDVPCAYISSMFSHPLKSRGRVRLGQLRMSIFRNILLEPTESVVRFVFR